MQNVVGSSRYQTSGHRSERRPCSCLSAASWGIWWPGKLALGDAEQQEIHKSKLWRFFDS
jgi:hypothetical protein